MPVFQYTARTLKGELQSGEVDLPTRDDVIAHLRKNRMVVVQVRAAPKAFKLSFTFGGGIKTRDLVVMTRQFAAIAIAVLLIFVIPTFQNMFASVNLELPLPTRIVIGMSSILTHYWWAIIGAMGGFVFLLSRWYKTAPGRLQIDKLLLRLPVLGDVIRKSAVSRFTRTLGTLISSGVSILDGLEITARTAGNMVIHNAVMESRASIAGGETVAGPL